MYLYGNAMKSASTEPLHDSLLSLLWYWLARKILGNIRLDRRTRPHTVIYFHYFMEWRGGAAARRALAASSFVSLLSWVEMAAVFTISLSVLFSALKRTICNVGRIASVSCVSPISYTAAHHSLVRVSSSSASRLQSFQLCRQDIPYRTPLPWYLRGIPFYAAQHHI